MRSKDEDSATSVASSAGASGCRTGYEVYRDIPLENQQHTQTGIRAPGLHIGQRVGVAWIASACGHCQYCLSGQENLCPEFKATGHDVNGGYAEFMKVPADFVHPIPDSISDSEATPLLCAGAVGYRALKLCNLKDGQTLGLMGFGG